MRKSGSVTSLQELWWARPSETLFLHDFLYREVANFYSVPSMPDNPDLAIEAST